MLDEIYLDLSEKMEKAIEKLKRELAGVRTGRASLALLDGIKVEYYGVMTPINQTATISIPEANLIVIQPWDPSTLSAIEKAIQKSTLGITPMNDGRILRIVIPPLTEERRKEIVKLVKKMGEDTRIVIRNHRRDGNEEVKKLEKNKEISEDDAFKARDEIQKITDNYIEQVDKIIEQKEKEILTF